MKSYKTQSGFLTSFTRDLRTIAMLTKLRISRQLSKVQEQSSQQLDSSKKTKLKFLNLTVMV